MRARDHSRRSRIPTGVAHESCRVVLSKGKVESKLHRLLENSWKDWTSGLPFGVTTGVRGIYA